MSAQYVMDVWKDAGFPKEMPSTAFSELKGTSAARTRAVLGIQAVKRGKRWVWTFDALLSEGFGKQPDEAPKVEAPPPVEQKRLNPTENWQRGQSMRMEYPLPPSPYAPPQGPVSPTASGGPDTFDWVTKGKGSYVVDSAGGKHPTTFWEV